ncbi:MAG: CapA family protein [Tyzzerella sp.]|nr:CapA family protein [Tyzzerella sp.]
MTNFEEGSGEVGNCQIDQNHVDSYETKRKIRNDAIRQKRKRQRAIIIGVFAVSALAVIVAIIVAASAKILKNARQDEAEKTAKEKVTKEAQELQLKREENAKTLLEQLYVSILPEDASVPVSNTEEETFSKWFFENYEDDVTEKLLTAADDGELTSTEIYQSVGESMHVLSDRYQGLLKDEEIAAQNNIYIRDGKNESEVEITIAGDLCLAEDGFVLDHYDTVNDLTKCISPEILEITNQSDIFYLNHEYCISDQGTPLEGKYYTFRANPERMSILEQMGTDIVSLANNHVYDYGKNALLDTADLLEETGIPYVGGGRDIEEAKRPIYFIVNGIKIGFVGASNGEKIKYTPQATEDSPGILRAYDTTEYNQVIQEASKECDYLIAYIHWGTEDSNYYNSDQQNWGREFLNSGADIVIGGHPHVLQGMEYVDGNPIIYSLGDFWFNHETKYTGILKLNIGFEGLEEMSFVPCLQTGFTTQYLDAAEEQEKLYFFLEKLSPNIEIDSQGVITQTQN